jgi:superfamily I DNA/RNA helicase
MWQLAPGIHLVRVALTAGKLTYTRIWLEKVAAELAAAGTNPNEILLFGFDISAAQFPEELKHRATFVLSDINEGFPEQHHGTFDTMHVRLLVLALQV